MLAVMSFLEVSCSRDKSPGVRLSAQYLPVSAAVEICRKSLIYLTGNRIMSTLSFSENIYF